MRIWHEQLIPILCRQHLLAMWREGLGMYSIITENKTAYRNHPATKEFENVPLHLVDRLYKVRKEMLKRGYNPKKLPTEIETKFVFDEVFKGGQPKEWQSLAEQIEILKAKKCDCRLDELK